MFILLYFYFPIPTLDYFRTYASSHNATTLTFTACSYANTPIHSLVSSSPHSFTSPFMYSFDNFMLCNFILCLFIESTHTRGVARRWQKGQKRVKKGRKRSKIAPQKHSAPPKPLSAPPKVVLGECKMSFLKTYPRAPAT